MAIAQEEPAGASVLQVLDDVMSIYDHVGDFARCNHNCQPALVGGGTCVSITTDKKKTSPPRPYLPNIEHTFLRLLPTLSPSVHDELIHLMAMFQLQGQASQCMTHPSPGSIDGLQTGAAHLHHRLLIIPKTFRAPTAIAQVILRVCDIRIATVVGILKGAG